MKDIQKLNKLNIESMRISNEKLLEFIEIFKELFDITLSEKEALERANILLRTVSLIYKPISIKDYSSVIAKKMYLKNKSLKIIN